MTSHVKSSLKSMKLNTSQHYYTTKGAGIVQPIKKPTAFELQLPQIRLYTQKQRKGLIRILKQNKEKGLYPPATASFWMYHLLIKELSK